MKRPGPLVILGGVFAVSIALRAGEVAAELSSGAASPAHAAAPTGDAHGDGHSTDQHAEETHVTPPTPTYDPAPALSTPASAGAYSGETCVAPELFSALRERESELQSRADAVADREAELQILERRLEERIQVLAQTKNELEELVAQTEMANAEDIERLVRMYQAMKPKEAGEIFNAMEESFAAGFLAQMRPDAAALILANMEAEKAYAVSLIIAGRNARAPRR